MADTIRENVFDSEAASAMVNDLRLTFESGKTRSYKWRVSQLEALIDITDRHHQEIVQALYADLSKSETEAFIQEVFSLSASTLPFTSIKLILLRIDAR